MRVLVTGGGGFLGSAICRQLLVAGHQVVAYQRSAAPALSHIGVQVARGEIDDADSVGHAATGCEAVIHSAGKAGIWGRMREYHRINVLGTKVVLEASRTRSVGLLVHTSSPSIVHAGADIEGADESLPVASHFIAPYPETKAEAERMVLAANCAGLRTTALRPHLIWGPGDPHILPRLKASVRRGVLRLPGADKRIDTVFVENAALAHVLAMNELTGEGRCAGRSYFISNDEPLAQGDIVARLLAAAGVIATIRPAPAWLARTAGRLCELAWKLLRLSGEPPVTRFSAEQLCTAHWFDISAAKRDLDYRPRYSIVEGLRQLAAASQPPRPAAASA